MLKDGFISFEEFVDFVFSTGDKDFLSDAELEYDSSLPGVSRRKSGRKRGKAGRTLLSHFEAFESSQVFIDF